jgi:hypothetical protein
MNKTLTRTTLAALAFLAMDALLHSAPIPAPHADTHWQGMAYAPLCQPHFDAHWHRVTPTHLCDA